MASYLRSIVAIAVMATAFIVSATAQDLSRELKLPAVSYLNIINKYGRVSISAPDKAPETATDVVMLAASSSKGVVESELKQTSDKGVLAITVVPTDKKKRVDISVTVPFGAKVTIETADGAVDVAGRFAKLDIVTETGTIATNIPTSDVAYQFEWTESRPRVVSDIDLEKIKERTGGRFEIKGRMAETRAVASVPDEPEKLSQTTDLHFTTARGIILVNVPPSEVGSDLRERPLTNAAKAIVRSGDGLLMEAIRRAAPRYYGEYAASLPPIKLEPRFAPRAGNSDAPSGEMKEALVRVTDLKNRAIPGLKASDFEITESGNQREIVSVTPSTAPFNLVLLLDVSGSVENYQTFIRKAARAFVDTVDKNDRVSIVTFNDDIKVLSKFTTDKRLLSASLDTFDAGGGTAYYDALAYTVAETLRPLKGERTAIVVLTDGDDNRSFLAFDSLAGSIQESGALIYPLYVPSGLIAAAATGANADIDPLRKKYMSLSAKSSGEGPKLANISGGVYYPITQVTQIQQAYEDIVVQLRTAYIIRFRSTTADGNSPRLKIRSKKAETYASVQSVNVVN
ncbi:MAG TPA: VWA domain-containing protein [Pyrinomonadaceae bacterium]|nr:VWA domain-containing protein [Pyrinomonadaceae bacterium]